MKRFLVHIILFMLALPAMAQTYLIPDTNFFNYLRDNFANQNLIEGNQSINTYSASFIQGSINCSNLGINNLDGIQYFKKINVLDCSGNNLTTLPSLTNLDLLQELICDHNKLTSLPRLDNKSLLYKIKVDFNQLDSLPSTLGLLQLKYLIANNNKLQILPSLIENNKLEKIFVYSNKLTSLPELSTNTALKELLCQDNLLSSLPSLNNNRELMHIDCGDNQLTQIQPLTNNILLHTFGCSTNQLTQLPPLNHLKKLAYFFCNENQLEALPSMENMDSLSFFSCSKNKLRELPSMNGCERLYTIEADSNQLKNIPELALPWLRHLVLANNELESLPQFSVELNSIDLRNNFLSFEDLLPLNPTGSIENNQLFPQRSIRLGDPIQLNEGETQTYELTFDRQVQANHYYWSDNGIPVEAANDGSIAFSRSMKLSLIVKNDSFPNDSLTSSVLQVFVNTCVNENCDEFVLSPNGDGEGDDYFCDVTGTIEIMNRDGRIVKTLQGPAKWTGEGHPTGYFLIFVDGKRVAALTLVR